MAANPQYSTREIEKAQENSIFILATGFLTILGMALFYIETPDFELDVVCTFLATFITLLGSLCYRPLAHERIFRAGYNEFLVSVVCGFMLYVIYRVRRRDKFGLDFLFHLFLWAHVAFHVKLYTAWWNTAIAFLAEGYLVWGEEGLRVIVCC